MQIGEESYSLKKLERHHGFVRVRASCSSPPPARELLLVLQRLEHVQPRRAPRREDRRDEAGDDRGDHEHDERPDRDRERPGT